MTAGLREARSPGVLVDGDVVRIRIGNTQQVALHRLALRDGCSCEECRHPVSGQRLYETRDVVPGAQVASAALDDGGLRISWADGHESSFDRAWLGAAAQPRPRRGEIAWDASLARRLP